MVLRVALDVFEKVEGYGRAERRMLVKGKDMKLRRT